MEALIFGILWYLRWEGVFAEGRMRVNLHCSSSLLYFSVYT